jgi:hypothetical protein
LEFSRTGALGGVLQKSRRRAGSSRGERWRNSQRLPERDDRASTIAHDRRLETFVVSPSAHLEHCHFTNMP